MGGQDGSFLAEYVLEREYAGATHRVRELAISFDHIALDRRSRPSGLVHVDVKKLGRLPLARLRPQTALEPDLHRPGRKEAARRLESTSTTPSM
jgi:hypothetical protein